MKQRTKEGKSLDAEISVLKDAADQRNNRQSGWSDGALMSARARISVRSRSDGRHQTAFPVDY